MFLREMPRNVEEDLKEHKRHLEKKNANGSTIAEYVIKSGHKIAWDRAKIMDYEQKWGARKIKESLHIKSKWANRQPMNRDAGSWPLARFDS